MAISAKSEMSQWEISDFWYYFHCIFHFSSKDDFRPKTAILR